VENGRPTVAELRAAVERMERRLAESDDELTATLLAQYRTLSPRFAADLGDERDVLLSRGAALMLIQAVASRTG
jgi:hypothetical protein